MGDTNTVEEETSLECMSSKDISVHKNIMDVSNYRRTYLSVIWCGGCLGAAYYETDTCVVHMLLESVESRSFELVRNLIEELNPAAIITSARQDDLFVSMLKEAICEAKRDDDERENLPEHNSRINDSTNLEEQLEPHALTCVLEMLSSVEYRYEISRRRILCSKLPTIPDHYDELEKAMYFSSTVPFECIATIRATGGLIRYLEKKRVSVGLESADVRTPISMFQTFSLKNSVYLDKNSYNSLQIFRRVSHPSAYKISSREGLSLYRVLNRTATHIGQKLMKTWFCRPTCDANVLNRRFEAVAYFIDPKNEEATKNIKDSLRNIKNVSRMIARMKTASLSVADWIGLSKTVQNALRIADTCRAVALSNGEQCMPAVLQDVIRCFKQDLTSVVTLVTNTVDFEVSKAQNKFAVKSGVFPTLDRLTDAYTQLPAVLGEIARRELENYSEHISACQVVYLRRIGFLLLAPKSDTMKDRGSFEVPGLEFVADSEDSVYYKSPTTQQLNTELGDILEDIATEEGNIRIQLQSRILEHSAVLLDVMQVSAELDCLMAFATVAKEQNYVRPTMNNGNEIVVLGGRHPLQELTVALFVPNDVQLGPGHGVMKILTGPNASGKSVYLKQVGLIVFMAHIGCYVPAERAVIGLVSRIFTRIKTEESVSSGLSSFATDLSQMSVAVREAGRSSLVLIDEFGKGTATVDGVSLLASCLQHWIEPNGACPFVICATHFHSLVQQNLLPVTPLLRYQTMSTIRDQGTSNTVFLFQLVDGVSEQSLAAHVAGLAGVPSEIVDRGREVSEMFRRNAPVRRFDRASSVTYARKCREVTQLALACDLEDSNAIQQLLASVKNALGSRKHGGDTMSSSFDETTVSEKRAKLSSTTNTSS